jgi:hypothetical protein
MEPQGFSKKMERIIERHGVESVQTQFNLMRIFHSQHNPATDPPLQEYLVQRLKDYNDKNPGL